MNFHAYHSLDVVNGDGTRCTLFVAGCEHKCPGCYNATTWALTSGEPFTTDHEDRIIRDLNDSRIRRQGLSLSGGDPLHPANTAAVLKLVKRVKTECPDKDIWCWTGYRLSELSDLQREIIPYLDVLIDGRFEQERKQPNLKWRGSDNQIIHHLNESDCNRVC